MSQGSSIVCLSIINHWKSLSLRNAIGQFAFSSSRLDADLVPLFVSGMSLVKEVV